MQGCIKESHWQDNNYCSMSKMLNEKQDRQCFMLKGKIPESRDIFFCSNKIISKTDNKEKNKIAFCSNILSDLKEIGKKVYQNLAGENSARELPEETNGLNLLHTFKPYGAAREIRCDNELNAALLKLKRGQFIQIGRSPENQYIHTEDTVSSHHALIVRGLDGNLYIIDRGSTNGTFINHNKLEANEPVRINMGDQITITKNIPVIIYPEVLSLPPDVEISKTTHPAIPDEICFRILEFGEIYAGRVSSKDSIKIAYDDTISRYHVKFQLSSNGLFLTDNNSTNGTYVNGEKINSTIKLHHNNKVQMGNTIYVYDEKKNIFYTFTNDAKTFNKYFPDGLDNLKFNQSSEVGDCYLLASIKSIADNPGASRYLGNMIKESQNGDVIVRFYGEDKDITIPAGEVQAILKDKGVIGQPGLKLIERAYGRLIKPQRQQEHPEYRGTLLLMKGGCPHDVMASMVPCKTRYIQWDSEIGDNYYLPQKKAELEATLKAFSNNVDKTLLCAGTRKVHNEESKGHSKILHVLPDGMEIAQKHGYSIKAVNPLKKSITIVNPWYANKSSEITYDDFFKYFCTVYQGILL